MKINSFVSENWENSICKNKQWRAEKISCVQKPRQIREFLFLMFYLDTQKKHSEEWEGFEFELKFRTTTAIQEFFQNIHSRLRWRDPPKKVHVSIQLTEATEENCVNKASSGVCATFLRLFFLWVSMDCRECGVISSWHHRLTSKEHPISARSSFLHPQLKTEERQSIKFQFASKLLRWRVKFYRMSHDWHGKSICVGQNTHCNTPTMTTFSHAHKSHSILPLLAPSDRWQLMTLAIYIFIITTSTCR